MEKDERLFATGNDYCFAVWVKREHYAQGDDLPPDAAVLYAVHMNDSLTKELVGYIAPIEEQWLAVDFFGERTTIHDRAELFTEMSEAVEWLHGCYWSPDSHDAAGDRVK